MHDRPLLRDLGEFGLHRRIREILGAHSPDVWLGLGDDAAVVRTRSGALVITTDAMVEGIHFKPEWTSAPDLAYKALASTLSDLAAKCAVPAYGVITLGLPPDTPVRWTDEFYHTLAELQQEWGMEVIGGDTVRSPLILVSITAFGYQESAQPLSIGGAQAGDRILVTGTLGDAAAGLRILLGGAAPETWTPAQAALVRRFRRPTPRLREALDILRTAVPHSMTDISDGLARDLVKLCEASGTGARIVAAHLPCGDDLRSACESYLSLAWQGGEDYELLLTLSPAAAETLLKSWDPARCALTDVGVITPAPEGIRVEGGPGEWEEGFDHFRV
ncbi:MAG TPA: thiamine-phosphate kinase [bacterium]|nr:thiamine-phosphate kinase [Candidatus Omnitrophota bacterium]HOJ61250.1 thiamine-phosphate kinase [bacterium]HOL94887.1 thiamine-phosphate kinase [bacterium]HPP00516.1 thiamine-phosphate kinase [bacterium]